MYNLCHTLIAAAVLEVHEELLVGAEGHLGVLEVRLGLGHLLLLSNIFLVFYTKHTTNSYIYIYTHMYIYIYI